MNNQRELERFRGRIYVTFSLSLLFIAATIFSRFWGASYSLPAVISDIGTAVVSAVLMYEVYKSWGCKTSIAIRKKTKRILLLLILAISTQVPALFLMSKRSGLLTVAYIMFGLILAVINMFL
ncbi:hypothetical protein M1394_01730 [Candidatus Marsarchaeota archaeon]|nr:hypothetical protein [Candidatus Marsarchaeota archaeon]